MREKFKQKPLVAVLLPILFLLVAIISVYQWNPLKADDQNAHLVDVKVNGKKIDDNYSETEQRTLLEISAKEPQLLKFLESDKYKLELLNEKGELLPYEKLSNEKLTHFQGLVESTQKSDESAEKTDSTSSSTTETSAPPETEEILSQLFYVVEDKEQVPYLLLDKGETIWLGVTNKKPEEATSVVLEVPNANKKQKLFNFEPKKVETTETSKKEEKASSSSESKENTKNSEKQQLTTSESSTSNNERSTSSSSKKEETSSSKEKETTKEFASKATKLTKEEKKQNLVIEKLLDEKYEEKDSFKPIELPIVQASTKEAKAGSTPISVTGAQMKIQTGTGYEDPGNDNPGYDSEFDGEKNDRVRSFDSNIYLLTFSIEASDPTTTYSNIKYRVDMELPNAYALDSSGKQRFNAEVVDSENGELVDTSPTTKTSKGYVESTLAANGQVLLPMLVNVYGAQNDTVIQPTMKLTIISAVNDKSGKTEEINLTYDKSNMKDLGLPKTFVSAKASVTASIAKGNRTGIKNFIPSWTGSADWDAVGMGVTFELTPIDGRGSADFKGATFPNGEISLKIASETNYKKTVGQTTPDYVTTSDNPSDSTNNVTRPLKTVASSVATDSISGWQQILHSPNPLSITPSLISLPTPLGKTQQLHVVAPNVSADDRRKIGVFDSGKVTVTNDGALSMTLKNSDYTPIYNPYTYRYSTGAKTSDNQKIFSSSAMIVQWCREYLKAKGTGILSTNIKLASISYEGKTVDLSSRTDKTITLSDSLIAGGNHSNGTTFSKNTGLSEFVGVSSNGRWDISNGDGKLGQGESNIYVGGSSLTGDNRAREVHSYVRWNPMSFEYDESRNIYSQGAAYGWLYKDKTRYGVLKAGDYPPKKVASESNLESYYWWYTTPQEAKATGKISAVKFVNNKPNNSFSAYSGAPVKVIGQAGAKDQNNMSHIALFNTYWFNSAGIQLGENPPANVEYVPTVFNSNTGGVSTPHQSNPKDKAYYMGDTVFITKFRMETTTAPEKPVYRTNETIKWKVNGNLLTESDTDYTVKLTTTLPAGLKYTVGSSVDSLGNPLPEPTIVTAGNGLTTLVWEFNNVNPSMGDIAEVRFETTPSLKDLSFDKLSLAAARVSTVGEMWVQGNPNQKDTSPAGVRSSYGQVQLYQTQQIVLTKEVDKSAIEVGKKDAANTSASNDITYKVTLENYSSDKLLNVKVVDELPYDGDDFGSKIDGSYSVKDIKITKGNGNITYSKDPILPNERDNPNDITGAWGIYVPGVSNPTSIKDAKAFLITANELDVTDQLVFEVTISPDGQKAGNIYRNRATFNSKIELPVSSNIVQTQVYGRDLTGYVWYDDDYDGLIGYKSGGLPEDPVGNIPVKLYRTSLVNGSYQKELVTESLTGQQFIDGDGNSLIKTGTVGQDKGKYKFENLPEGEYLAEFMVGDLVTQKKVIVTKKFVGSDESKNSKADPNTYKTPEYEQPELNDLQTRLTGTDKVYHVNHVNAGLTPLSKIRLFKYEEGTVIDANNDGKLSDAEIEALTTKALAGAEFQLYKGKFDDPDTIKDANKIGTVKVTGNDGWLEFDIGLPPGDYTIVETKAPPGFELLKDPIGVNVPTYNYVAVVHVADKGQTKLPFTGSTKALRIILIAAAVLMVVGMTSVFLHFRPINVKGGK
ncbi:SpaA isopeptide-forming pilin-related protein [Enterococcus gilvus]|uniref:SpaA isopeptide-forming pilin-related protein n=1 Tax=Enterococcus gilvus TaxID=160453 RepID=UPI001C8CE97F|nr:SpaA isopeptide-forming pilin-related protein [Enterococcus gilvus]MBX8938627.1 hypothetical protein [Enterococcus gilvus]